MRQPTSKSSVRARLRQALFGKRVSLMTTTSDDYEEFIADLIGHIQNGNRNITDLGYGRNNTIEGICGQPHQIDVSFVDHDYPNPTLVLIECKRYGNKPIDLEHVKVLKATMDDILAHPETPNCVNAIVTTTFGARSGAQRFADYYGILIEQVSHGPNYDFQYENVIQIGTMVKLKLSDTATAVVVRKCQSCGSRFNPIDTEVVCSQCSSSATEDAK